MSTVTVDREALRLLLKSVDMWMNGDASLIREIQSTLHLQNNPMVVIVRDFNASVAYQTITDGLFGGEE